METVVDDADAVAPECNDADREAELLDVEAFREYETDAEDIDETDVNVELPETMSVLDALILLVTLSVTRFSGRVVAVTEAVAADLEAALTASLLIPK